MTNCQTRGEILKYQYSDAGNLFLSHSLIGHVLSLFKSIALDPMSAFILVTHASSSLFDSSLHDIQLSLKTLGSILSMIRSSSVCRCRWALAFQPFTPNQLLVECESKSKLPDRCIKNFKLSKGIVKIVVALGKCM